jgi:hypothetical protein
MSDENPGAVGADVPSFHDGRLNAVALGANGATLGLCDSGGNAYELELTGLEALQIDGFRAGNLISRVQVITGRKPRPHGLDEEDVLDLMNLLFPPPHATSDETACEAHDQMVAGRLARIETGEATLVVIDPSYGADVVAICAGASLRGPL